ncbi:hypothetical protein [Sphingomicrobium lutaoense]|uniref:Uncharacterized protein n=1 Tax=Sphingomicrobium lutaoense TaxID=515949 RepID=A0A839YSA5_9SPHN|nr:hypothetical protein [Sphingomicrobium lutaoense]MBB3763171.1 hypothetical protein [Sphingomicrobium lutaoense]
MLRSLITAVAGRKVAQNLGGGAIGTAAATALPFVAKRGLGPLGVALTAGWAAKKYMDYRRSKKMQAYPPSATPTPPPAA